MILFHSPRHSCAPFSAFRWGHHRKHPATKLDKFIPMTTRNTAKPDNTDATSAHTSSVRTLRFEYLPSSLILLYFSSWAINQSQQTKLTTSKPFRKNNTMKELGSKKNSNNWKYCRKKNSCLVTRNPIKNKYCPSLKMSNTGSRNSLIIFLIELRIP